MSKPIDLIVANAMHEVAEAMRLAEKFSKAVKGKAVPIEVNKENCAHIARHLLCQIAHNGSKTKVYAALKLLGAPCSDADIREGVQAVMEFTE